MELQLLIDLLKQLIDDLTAVRENDAQRREIVELSRRAAWAIEAPFEVMQRFCHGVCLLLPDISD